MNHIPCISFKSISANIKQTHLFPKCEDEPVRQHLQSGQTAALSQPQAISGLGGIGKTQFALEYAYRYRQDYHAVLWARAESREVLLSSYAAIASLLQLPEREAKEQAVIVQAVKHWLQVYRGWLLILDNADELTVLPDFLPPTLGGHLLLTTRAVATGRLAYRLEIEVLQPRQGALFLLKRAAPLAPDATLEQVSSQEQELAMQITQELGGLPLALDQAEAYLEETGCSLGTYLNLFHTHRVELLKRTSNVLSDHPQSVATTLFLSFQQVEQTSLVAANVLRLCAFLDPDTISEAIIVEEASESSFLATPFPTDVFTLNEAIEALRKLSLVKRLSEKGQISVHRLVQAVIQEGMDEETRERWAKQAVIMVNKAFPDIYKISWSQRQHYLPQARVCRSLILHYGFSSVEAAQLLYKAAGYMMSSGPFDEEDEQMLQEARSIFEKVVGSTHVSTLNTLSRLARLYDGMKRFELSQELWQHLVSTYENLKGSEHPTVARYLGHLAQSYRYQGRLDLAEQFSLRALAICEKTLGDSDQDTVEELLGLAIIYRSQGKHEEAEPLYLRALTISESILGNEDDYTAICLHVLATCYLEQSKYELAEPLLQRSLTIHENAQDIDYGTIARILEELAYIYTKQGKNELVDSLYQRAITALEKNSEDVQGPFSVADYLERIAEMKQDRYAAAIEARIQVIRSQAKM